MAFMYRTIIVHTNEAHCMCNSLDIVLYFASFERQVAERDKKTAKALVIGCFNRIASLTVLAVDCTLPDISVIVKVSLFDQGISDACIRSAFSTL